MKILGIGEIVLDKTYTISGEMCHGQKCQSNDSLLCIGGPVSSALKLLTNLGCETTIIGSIGKGPLGKYVKEQFDLYGINYSLVQDKATKVNTVLIDEKTGTRTIIKDKIHNKLLVEIPISYIKEADIIIFDRTEKKVFDFVLKHKRKKTKIIIDPGTEYSLEIIHMIKNSYIPILPIEVLYKVTEENNFFENVKKLYNVIEKTLIITDGEKGAYVFDGKEVKTYKAIDICPIDTNGAGDVFRGGIGWGVLNNWDLEKCITYANKVAGLQCMKMGNLSAIPEMEEIEKFIY
ncbi:MAG: carbohydrate kinase family protein [Candidatus Gracilibacteria bacterium]